MLRSKSDCFSNAIKMISLIVNARLPFVIARCLEYIGFNSVIMISIKFPGKAQLCSSEVRLVYKRAIREE